MKKKIAVGILILMVLIMLTGCESWNRFVKSIKSDTGGGLNRTVEVYSNDGDLLKTYEGKFDIEENESGNKVLFDIDGKRVILYNATVITEEIIDEDGTAEETTE